MKLSSIRLGLILLIKSVRAEDAGNYECQVSTEKKLSRSIELIVVVPKVRILGMPAIYVEEGSSVQLECVVSQAVLTPKYIIWEFNGSGIGGSTYTQIDKSTTTSTLSLNWLSAQNAGVYSCKPAQLDAAIVQLFVLDSEGNQVALLNSGISQSSLAARVICIFYSILIISTYI